MQHTDSKTFESLFQEQQWPALSIYMPVSRTGDPQDSVRFKNLLGQAQELLIEEGLRSAESRHMLERWSALVEDAEYLKHAGADGLALFQNGEFEQHHLLPHEVDEVVQVGTHFHIKPLLPLLKERSCLLLGLNRGKIRLYKIDRFNIKEMALPEEVPQGMEDTLQYDDPERQLQYHSKTQAQGDKRNAMYHGQGVGIDEKKSNLERYFQAVDSALAPLFQKQGLPVILGGTDEMQGNFRRVTRCRNLLPRGLAKNISELSDEEIHSQTWEIAEPFVQTNEDDALARYAAKQGTGLTLDSLSDVLRAAYEGRVDSLFAATDRNIWGVFNPETLETEVVERNGAPTVDLIDEAIFWTFARGGRVFGRKREFMPEHSSVCALLRF